MKKLVIKRRDSLLQQKQDLEQEMQRLGHQRQAISVEMAQRTADLNAVEGALQVCDSLLAELGVEVGEDGAGSALERLKDALGADSVEVVSSDEE